MTNRKSIFFLLFLAIPFAQSFLSSTQVAEEYGIASYYGDEFHGRKTASGERYDKNELTCAHKTYAFGSKIRVTRLDNKKSVVVRVNDRGPFIKGYVVDLSRKAASSIGMLDDGIVKVKIELVEGNAPKEEAVTAKPEERSKPEKEPAATTAKSTETAAPAKSAAVPDREAPKPEKEVKEPKKYKETSKTEPLPKQELKTVTAKDFKQHDLYAIELKRPEKKGFGVQVVTLENYENVFQEVAKLQGNWDGKVLVMVEPGKTDEEKHTYKLILGPFSDKKTAEKNQKTASKKGYKKCFIIDLSE